MRELKALGPARPVPFVASTRHELGHDGLKHYLQRRQALIAGAGAWIHPGANLGAAVRDDGPRLLQVSDAGLQEVARQAMAGRA